MALNVVLMTQRQSPNGMALNWGVMEGVASYTVFIASRKLTPEELEAAMALGGTDDCVVAKFGSETVSVVDDVSTAGEARFYGVAMSFSDGAVRAARFRRVPDGATAESRPVSGAGKKAAPAARPAAAAPRPAAAAAPAARPAGAAPATGNTGSYRVAGAAPAAAAPRPAAAAPAARPAAAAPAAEEDPMEARKRAQREARARMAGEAAPAAAAAPAEEAPAQEEAPPEEDPMEARKRAQREARERAAAASSSSESSEAAPAARAAPAASEEDPMEARKRAQAAARAAREGGGGGDAPAASAEPVKQPGDFPLDSPLEIRMSGGTQTWDGLRIYWEREPRAAAYEIVVSDHQIFSDELGEALSGKADFTAAVAVAPSVTAIIDNITPREARGWYLVLVRNRDGSRAAHPFKVGDAAESGKAVAGFVNPNRTGELRAEVEDLLGQAKENWDRWKSEQDGGAKREAQRLVKDALLIFPNYPAAKTLAAETGS